MQAIDRPTAELSIEIAAAPEQVWAVVSDVTRIPEWSPVCRRCEWLDGEHPVVGARFRGHNRLNGIRWSRECVVTGAEPNRVFAFSTVFKGQESTRWQYRLEPTGSGTVVCEAYQVVATPLWVRALRLIPAAKRKTERDTISNIRTSLERLKALVELPADVP